MSIVNPQANHPQHSNRQRIVPDLHWLANHCGFDFCNEVFSILKGFSYRRYLPSFARAFSVDCYNGCSTTANVSVRLLVQSFDNWGCFGWKGALEQLTNIDKVVFRALQSVHSDTVECERMFVRFLLVVLYAVTVYGRFV